MNLLVSSVKSMCMMGVLLVVLGFLFDVFLKHTSVGRGIVGVFKFVRLVFRLFNKLTKKPRKILWAKMKLVAKFIGSKIGERIKARRTSSGVPVEDTRKERSSSLVNVDKLSKSQ